MTNHENNIVLKILNNLMTIDETKQKNTKKQTNIITIIIIVIVINYYCFTFIYTSNFPVYAQMIILIRKKFRLCCVITSFFCTRLISEI